VRATTSSALNPKYTRLLDKKRKEATRGFASESEPPFIANFTSTTKVVPVLFPFPFCTVLAAPRGVVSTRDWTLHLLDIRPFPNLTSVQTW
jgi:hypothetical protein